MYSFSAEDLKRREHAYLMNDQDGENEGKDVPKSPGIGNSEVKGRDYGFSSRDGQ
jgi:hypothetical protein